MKLLYPGHNYLGPGNELESGDPVDQADSIAQLHDYQYANARSELDVHKADLEAIGKFSKSSFESGFDLPSATGAVGLTAKKILEAQTGQVLYPFEHNSTIKGANEVYKFFGGKSFLPDVDSKEHIAMPKRSREDSESTVTASEGGSEMSVDQKPQAGSSMPGGTGSDVMATIIKNPHLPNYSFSFRKTFQIYTGGFQYNKVNPEQFFLNPDQQNVFAPGVSLLLTPLACLDPGMLPLYLTPFEYQQLPAMSYATSCSMKVTPLGYRLPFQTNESSAGYANSQTLVQCAHSVGLNTMYNMTLTNYAINDADPTLIATTIANEPNYVELLYGSSETVGANTGRPVHLNMYTGIFQNQAPGGVADECSPNLLDNIQIQNVNDCKGTPLINFTHEFKNGLLKTQTTNDPRGTSNREAVAQSTSTTVGSSLAEGVNHLQQAEFQARNATYNFVDRADDDIYGAPTYNMTIEKSYWYERQVGQHQTPDYTPYVHFGCMPVPSNFALAAQESFAASVIQWQIETELHIQCNLNSQSANYIRPYTKSYDPVVSKSLEVPVNWGRSISICNRRLGNLAPPPTSNIVKINRKL